jgi:hypothetical protein
LVCSGRNNSDACDFAIYYGPNLRQAKLTIVMTSMVEQYRLGISDLNGVRSKDVLAVACDWLGAEYV